MTGASRGLGAAAAVAIAAEGAHLILVARTVGGLEETDDAVRRAGGSATLVPLDLKEGERIDQLGAALHSRFGKLDMLVAAAGALGTLTPVGHIRPEHWADVMAVNLTANWRLIRSLDPLLRLSDAGRAVFVSCPEATGRDAYWAGYAVSKGGLETLVRLYAAELANTRVRANIFDPGAMRTGLRAAAFPGEDPTMVPSPDDAANAMLPMLMAAYPHQGERVVFA
ncbi:NAD(P)-dependent dehydrogenase (short-subunit alcohol dehydrogenase family) [Stella humosa]|uniref:NAD(P)-dependent dehydrogenase (Short-subunit alcohol dehydrogenase family) n=1 Tax=Stella humosa TaxID=94 RepID=A0A3N1MDE4_9PROT|nr:SDR family NAD(P)-dependent oxidoreductase [Stella humosa]ROQ01309.1 NAD(P)-dependent dehydrogenase (short-subunit alcohol dehydrogenase family) [Stella humosa]BBK31683.1 short-chain dehydrogenase [Stella humosa]